MHIALLPQIQAAPAVFTNLAFVLTSTVVVVLGVAAVLAIPITVIVHRVRRRRLAVRGDLTPRRGYWFGIAAGALAGVLAAALLLGVVFPMNGPSSADVTDQQSVTTAEAVSAKGSPYAYLAPLLNVDPSHQFDYTYSVDLYDKKWGGNGSKAVAVFYDAALSQPADYVLHSDSVAGKYEVSISPASPTWHNKSDTGDREFEPYPYDDFKGGVWGPTNQLYLVRYVDQDGAKLPRPVVQPFTVDRKGFLPSPTVDYTITGDGALQLTWTAVPKATQYAVLAVTNNGDPGEAGGIISNGYSILGLLNKGETTWSSTGAGIDDAHGQNTILEHLTAGVTDPHVSYGVAALNDDDWASALNLIDGDSINADLPLQVASSSAGNHYDTVDAMPSRVAVETVSGDTVYFPATVDTTVSMAKAGFLRLRISGTNLVSSAGLTDTGDWAGTVAAAAAHLATMTTGTGGIRSDWKGAKPKDTTGITISRTAPKTAYKVNGFGDGFSEYLAANMLAGQQAIDVSKYVSTSPYDIYDLVDAVAAQNPYILGYWGAQYDPKAKVLWVKYRYTAEEMKAAQEQIASTVVDVVGQVTNAGQNDVQKAKALNDYLVDHATYNHDAFNAYLADPNVPNQPATRNAWTALGVLQDGTGVCASFAAAYKLLSDAAGLRTVYVTGTAGGPHAWDKTYLDGQWTVVDPTWNQGSQNDDLFAISDDVARTQFQHREDTDWMLDSMLTTYNAL
ncbi:transglutaminase domain-containing protein [Leifsonia aquatica]|uniref:transglutaminase domain-containing protein n=1 Tax=Leifsonia aquatica TaxID=144185 RepID=UPI003814CA9C